MNKVQLRHGKEYKNRYDIIRIKYRHDRVKYIEKDTTS